MSWNNALGAMGEEFAEGLLLEQGMQILSRGYRSSYGEIDLIACDDQYICFVEVKTRRTGSMVPGEAAVDAAKQRRIITTALIYLQEHDTDLQPRFDVISIRTDHKSRILDYNYLTGAFDGYAYTEHF